MEFELWKFIAVYLYKMRVAGELCPGGDRIDGAADGQTVLHGGASREILGKGERQGKTILPRAIVEGFDIYNRHFDDVRGIDVIDGQAKQIRDVCIEGEGRQLATLPVIHNLCVISG